MRDFDDDGDDDDDVIQSRPTGESVFPAHRLAAVVQFDSSHISLVRGRINYCTSSYL
jgi:hypothetical protein